MSPEKTSPKLREKGRIMSASEIERTLVRLAHEVVEKNNGAEHLGLVGIKRRGVPIAQRLAALIGAIEKHPVDTGVLDISFYRDDLSTHDVRPVVSPGSLGFDVNWSTTSCTPAAQSAPRWTRSSAMDVRAACSCWYLSTGDIVSCPSKPASSGARSRQRVAKSSK